MKEKRAKPRHSIKLVARLRLDLACSLVDVSTTGACILTNDAAHFPDKFQLHFNDGLNRWCLVKWRSKTRIGVAFIPDPTAKVAASAEQTPTLAANH
jgi:hypothetical protein